MVNSSDLSSHKKKSHFSRSTWLRGVRAVGAISLSTAFLVGCVSAPGGGEAAGDADATLTLAVPSEPGAMDTCDMVAGRTSRIITHNVGEGLTIADPTTRELSPLLATEWEQIEPNIWEFTLREDVTFHDGSPFNAAAVVKSFTRSLDPDLACFTYTQTFAGMEIAAEEVDEFTVRFVTGEPDPILPLRLTMVSFSGPETDTEKKVTTPVSTGPYQVISWDGPTIELERYDDYWGESARYSEVTYLARTEPSVRAGMLTTGEADIAFDIGYEYLDQEIARHVKYWQAWNVALDAQSEPFTDVRVREAVAHAIDREGLLQAIWRGAGEAANVPTATPVINGYDDGIKARKFDMDRAKELVSQAKADGVATDREITFFTRPAGTIAAEVPLAEAISAALNEIGLNAHIESMDSTPYTELLVTASTDRAGMFASTGDNRMGDASLSVNTRYPSWVARSRVPVAAQSEVDDLIMRAGVATDNERTELYQELYALLHDLAIEIPIVYSDIIMGVAPGVEYTPTPHSAEIIDLNDVVKTS
ncbi:ABC transporter substrate-binding protein [Homoserinimonas sp. A447]